MTRRYLAGKTLRTPGLERHVSWQRRWKQNEMNFSANDFNIQYTVVQGCKHLAGSPA